MVIFGYRIPMMASLLIWAVVWEFVGQFNLILLFPPLSDVLVAGVEVLNRSDFYSAFWVTVQCFAQGYFLAVAVGVPMGVAMGMIPAVDRLLSMWVSIFIATPLTPLVPVFMLQFGLGTEAVVVTAFMFAVCTILLDTRAGVSDVLPS
jgi:NitT/TauT family transport system permease protein